MFGWIRKLFGKSSGPPRVPTDTSPKGVYSSLRGGALSTRRAEVGIPAPPRKAPVWGMLMETGFPEATVTLFAVTDGTTSLYFSNGGGVLGGHAHESVREANAEFLETANRLSRHLTATTTFPVPPDRAHGLLCTDRLRYSHRARPRGGSGGRPPRVVRVVPRRTWGVDGVEADFRGQRIGARRAGAMRVGE